MAENAPRATILVLHGPNLNLLGQRESEYYGTTRLAELNQMLQLKAEQLGFQLIVAQHTGEAALIHAIHEAPQAGVGFIILNAGALTHTSIALRDALLAIDIPFIEVHISNIYRRETFRHHSYLADIANGVIIGLGIYGYELALLAGAHYLTSKLKG